jgi:transposase
MVLFIHTRLSGGDVARKSQEHRHHQTPTTAMGPGNGAGCQCSCARACCKLRSAVAETCLERAIAAPVDGGKMGRRSKTAHSETFKAIVALEAIRGDKTRAELAHYFDVQPDQVTEWKKQLVKGAGGVFAGATIKGMQARLTELALQNRFLEDELIKVGKADSSQILVSCVRALRRFQEHTLDPECRVQLALTFATIAARGQMRMKEIGSLTGLSQPSVSRNVARLVEGVGKGRAKLRLAVSEEDPVRRNGKNVRLTTEGERLAREMG